MKKFSLIALIGLLVFCSNLSSQVYSNKVVGEKNTALKDSLQQIEYPYILPIWGAKATKKGFNLPYSAGININYLWQESELVIDNLEVGFNHGQKHNLDEIIRFNNATSTANAINIRPDIWLFPFLNVYGILGKAKTSTSIDAGVYIPDSSNNWNQVTSLSTKAEFDATVFGLGFTPTVGIGGGWLALDMNVAWTDVDALEDPVFTFVFGPRLGKTFYPFKKRTRNIALWAGGFRVKFSAKTEGSLELAEVLPVSEWETKVNNGYIVLDENQAQIEEWWGNLTPLEQANPINQAKYDAANRAMDAAGKVLVGLEGAVSNAESASVQYSLDKGLKDKWNFIVGSQFQVNKHFMLRAEFGFLGSREQFIGGVQYRFGL